MDNASAGTRVGMTLASRPKAGMGALAVTTHQKGAPDTHSWRRQKGWWVQVRTTKVLAYAPGVLVSTVLTLILGVLLPAPGGWVVFLGSVLSLTVLLSGRAESVAVRAWKSQPPASNAARFG